MTASRSLGAAPAALLTILLLLACRPGTAERRTANGAPGMPASETPPSQDAKAAKAEVLSTREREIVLDEERTTVTVEAPTVLESVQDEGKKLGLYLEGVDFGQPGIYFDVYANLPAGAKPDPKGPHYVGTLSSFGPKGGPGTTVSYDITKLVRALEAGGRWSDEMKLTFIRRGLEPPPDQPGLETVPEDVPPVRVKRVKIVRE